MMFLTPPTSPRALKRDRDRCLLICRNDPKRCGALKELFEIRHWQSLKAGERLRIELFRICTREYTGHAKRHPFFGQCGKECGEGFICLAVDRIVNPGTGSHKLLPHFVLEVGAAEQGDDLRETLLDASCKSKRCGVLLKRACKSDDVITRPVDQRLGIRQECGHRFIAQTA